jgi:hypothetical protein
MGIITESASLSVSVGVPWLKNHFNFMQNVWKGTFFLFIFIWCNAAEELCSVAEEP